MDQIHREGIIGKIWKLLLGTPPYFGMETKPMSRAESISFEAANSPKSVAEVSAERTHESEAALEQLRREIHH